MKREFIADLDENLEDTKNGFVVPKYVDNDLIENLQLRSGEKFSRFIHELVPN